MCINFRFSILILYKVIISLIVISWEKEKLFDSWFSEDSSKIAAAAGVFLAEEEPSSLGEGDKVEIKFKNRRRNK